MQAFKKTAIIFAVIFFWVFSFIAGTKFVFGFRQRAEASQSINNGSGVAVMAQGNLPILDSTPPHIVAVDQNDPGLDDTTTIKLTTDEKLDPLGTLPYQLKYIGPLDQSFTYEVTITNLKSGDNQINLTLKDYAGNTLPYSVHLTRISDIYSTYDSVSGARVIINPNDLTAFVNKDRKIPDDYKPFDLINLRDMGLSLNNNVVLRKIAAPQTISMINAMRKAGINITISSGWRSFASQAKAYVSWVNAKGPDVGPDFAAWPGHSEHQLGTAIDMLTSQNGYTTTSSFATTKAGVWLSKYAADYGFVQSYPDGKELITGYHYEPWHYRYVGTEISQQIKQEGTTLTEYLKQVNYVE